MTVLIRKIAVWRRRRTVARVFRKEGLSSGSLLGTNGQGLAWEGVLAAGGKEKGNGKTKK
jgi:hypothetical protein